MLSKGYYIHFFYGAVDVRRDWVENVKTRTADPMSMHFFFKKKLK